MNQDRFSLADVLAVILLLVLLAGHAGINLFLFRQYEVPPYYDGANHFLIACDFYDHLQQFTPSWEWVKGLLSISDYYPPCYHLFTAVGFKLLGMTPDVARLVNMFFLAILVFSIFGIGRILLGTAIGLLAAILASFIPVFHGLTREIYTDLALAAWAAGATWCLLKTNHFQSRIWSLLFGVVCGLGLLTKWTFPVYVALPVWWMLSQTFLPISPARLLILVFRNDQKIFLAQLGLLFLSLTGTCLLLGIPPTLSAGYLFRLLLATPFLYLLARVLMDLIGMPPLSDLLMQSRRQVPPLIRSGINMLSAGVVMLVIALPWYIANWAFVSSEGARVLTEAAAVRNMPTVGSLASWLEYLVTLQSHQLGIFYFALVLLSIVFVVKRWNAPRLWLLLGTFVVSYLVMTALWVKDPRYLTPGLYPLPILIAWLVWEHAKAIRSLTVAVVLALSVLGYSMDVFHQPSIDLRFNVPTPTANSLVIPAPAVYGNLKQHGGNWPHHALVEKIAGGLDDHECHHIPVLVDDGFLHAPALNVYARVLGFKHLKFYNVAYEPDYRTDPGYIHRLVNLLMSPLFVAKSGGWLGPDFVTRVFSPILEDIFSKPDLSTFIYAQDQYPLPTGGNVILYRNTRPYPNHLVSEPVERSFSNGLAFQRFTILSDKTPSDSPSFQSDRLPGIVQLTWKPEMNVSLSDLISRYQFYIHLHRVRDDAFVAGWNVPLFSEPMEVAEASFHNRGEISTYAFLDQQREIAPGTYRFLVGLFDPATQTKVGLKDVMPGEIPNGVFLQEKLVYAPVSWEVAEAEFEDREALDLRGDIGSVILEAGRILDVTMTPGQQLPLTTRWHLNRLSLEYPQDKDVRAIAYLRPTIANATDIQRIGAVSWSLEVEKHTQYQMETFEKETLLTIPTGIPEGLYHVCIGVERPLYQRSAIIKSGPFSGQKAFCFRQPIHIGKPAWTPAGVEYPEMIELVAARVVPDSFPPNSEIFLETSWKLNSPKVETQPFSQWLLYAHLIHEGNQQTYLTHNFPLFQKDDLLLPNQSLQGLEQNLLLTTIKDGFTQRNRLEIPENLPTGTYRLELGFYDWNAAQKVNGSSPAGESIDTFRIEGLKVP